MALRDFLIACLGLGLMWTLAPGSPSPVADPAGAPQKYVGLLMAGDTAATAVVAAPGVIITSASAVYDNTATEPAWLPAGSVRFYPRYNVATLPPSNEQTGYIPAGFTRWTSYYEERLGMEEDPPFFQIETYNVDFVAAWFSDRLNAPELLDSPALHVDAKVNLSVLQENRDKVLAGYPVQSPAIPATDAGKLHLWPVADYTIQWEGLDGFFERDLTYASDLWFSVYTLFEVVGLQGMSGSPVFVRSDVNDWQLAGIILASKDAQSVFVRGIDANAYNWIQQAEFFRAWPGSGWLSGVFDAEFVPWLIHRNLGWIFIHEEPGNALYLWLAQPPMRRFLYTSEALYPFFYDIAAQAWLLYQEGSGTFGPEAVFVPVAGGVPIILE